MKPLFVVTNADGEISWSAKTEAAETFKTFGAAAARAKALAQSEPGKPIRVYTLEAEIVAPIGPLKVTRA